MSGNDLSAAEEGRQDHSIHPINQEANNEDFFDVNGWDKIYFSQFSDNPSDMSFLAVHDFRRLHMQNIYYYQRELLHRYPNPTELNKDNIGSLRTLLAAYTQALENYEYILRLPKPSSRKARVQREGLERLPLGVDFDRTDHRIIRGNTVGFLGRLFTQDLTDAAPGKKLSLWGKIGILCRELSWGDMLRRVVVGTFIGGPFLLVPMIILQFRDTKAWRLSTVSTAVIIFSVFLGVCSDANNGEHLGAVAAYAAVMVVFVGTTSSN